MKSEKPTAGDAFPSFEVPRLGGGTITLGKPENGREWQLIVVYRGKHCPLCTRYLKSLNDGLPDLHRLGVDVVALSADSTERANEHMKEVEPDYPVGFDLTVEQMQRLGLYISGPRLGMDAERPFAEPGLFVVNEESNLQIVDISNVPFARPAVDSLLMGLNFLKSRAGPFPVNGTYA